ncbi:hypothetical protein [Paenibacillus wulumuqiensis]|uniref:hypothetical protein n=1 Tax=Paenibacillus wulumuqiensis TaxID=1567107 RepID=UPI0006193F3A|nr:hypothetical protein [Paenibacillus wulumuqiensis]
MNWRVMCAALCMVCVMAWCVPALPVQAEEQEFNRIDVPSGSLITAHTSHRSNIPERVADGDLKTAWNAGRNSGVISVVFNQSVKMNGIEIAAAASPTSTEKYLIYGLEGDRWKEIGRASRTIEHREDGTVTMLDRIPVTEGNYSGVLISIDSSASWVSINELYLTTGTFKTFENATVSQLSGAALLTWEHLGYGETLIYYGTKPGSYTNKVVASWRGHLGTRIYNLTNDQPYYFKIAVNINGTIYYSPELTTVPKSRLIPRTIPDGVGAYTGPYYKDLNLTPGAALDSDIYSSWYYTNPNYPPNDDGTLEISLNRSDFFVDTMQLITQFSPVARDRSDVREDEYIIRGWSGWEHGWEDIGYYKATVHAPGGDGIVVLEPIAIKPGYYKYIEIEVHTTGTYVSINEVSLSGDPRTSVTDSVYGDLASRVTGDVYGVSK